MCVWSGGVCEGCGYVYGVVCVVYVCGMCVVCERCVCVYGMVWGTFLVPTWLSPGLSPELGLPPLPHLNQDPAPKLPGILQIRCLGPAKAL